MPSYATINDIRVSNHRKDSVTLSWITDTVTDGTVNYGTTQALGSSATDTTQRECGTHWVNLSGLSTNTRYYYEVVSGGETDNNNGQYYEFWTAVEPGTTTPYNVWGKVWKDKAKTTPAEGVIKYVTVTHGGNTSDYLSALTNSSGLWSVDLGNFKTADNTHSTFQYATGGAITTFAQGGICGTDTGNYTVSSTSPQELGEESLPVVLSAFTATIVDGKATLYWHTESEAANLGFNIYRSDTKDGKYVNINANLIKGAGTTNNPHDYQYVDNAVLKGKTYYYYIEDVDLMGNTDKSHVIVIKVIDKAKSKPIVPLLDSSKWAREKVGILTTPMRTALRQNFPNPFNPETWLPYQLVDDSPVIIRIYNVNGQLVRILNLGWRDAGYYLSKSQAAYWNGRDSFGEKVASGMYFYTLQAGDHRATRRMLIVK